MSLEDRYQQQCAALDVRADPTICRILSQQTQSSVRRLDFSSNFLGPSGVQALLESLRDCPCLEFISLENMYLKGESIPTLVSVVKTLPSLTSINLANNNTLGFSAAKLLLQVVKNNKRLVELDLEGTGIAPATQELISKYLTDNATSGAYWVAGSNHPSKSPSRTTADELPKQSYMVRTADGVSPAAEPAAPSDPHSRTERPLDYHKLAYTPQMVARDRTLQGSRNDAVQCEQLKAQVIDHEDRLHRMLSDLPNKARVKMGEFEGRVDTGTQNLADYYAVKQSIHATTYDDAQLVADLGLTNSSADIRAIHTHYQARPGAEPDSVIVKIIHSVMEMPKGVFMEQKAIDNSVCCLDPELLDTVKRLHHLLVTNPVTLETVLAVLNTNDEMMKRLQTKVDDAERSRAQAIEDEDMSRAESYHDESIKLQSALLKLIVDRLAMLLQPGEEMQLIAQVDEADRFANDRIDALRSEAAAAIDSVSKDLGTIDAHKEKQLKAYQDMCDNFDSMEKRSASDLQTNGHRQHQAWLDIIEAYDALVKLGDQRKGIVDKYIADRDTHERAKGAHEAWMATAADQQNRLQNLLTDAQNFVNCLDNLQLFVKQTTHTIHDRIDAVKAEIRKVLLDEQKRYLNIFRRFYLTSGELLYKKEKRLEEIEKMIEQNQFQIGFVKESLDPNAVMYRAHNMELTKLKDEIALKVEWLKDICDTASVDFAPTEEALKAAGVDFVSPTIELQELLVDRRAKVAEVREGFSAYQKAKLDKEKEDIQKQANVAKQAKMTGLTQLISPLSPRTGSEPSPAAQTTTPRQRIVQG
eukprot:TRINITY_DN9655_c0_g1_i1.p1 TRINITY_DN9655_c0_g1~~TRINITY_DN9655_c0_g1_i1.p1  ORF type:complete len:811 (+),score=210.83 TRINITY_DN9655_c0_g1_i1:64-2496(+)